ncbi:MAG: hypothetical protein ACI4ML_01840 [Aristaeellaceae bacterium]
MKANQLYPAVITLNRPETIFSDEDLLRLIQDAMGAETAELLRERLRQTTIWNKELRKTISHMQLIIHDLENDVTELEDMTL